MHKGKRRLPRIWALLAVALIFSASLSAQAQTVSQLIQAAGAGHAESFNRLVAMGVDIVPEIQRAFDERWPYHAYISQRTEMTRLLAALNHIDTVPALKSALIMEQGIREIAIDALLALDELTPAEIAVDLLRDPVDYQLAKLEMFRKLHEKGEDVVAILGNVFDALATDPEAAATIDDAADFLTRFIIEDKAVVQTGPLTREQVLAMLRARQNQAQQAGGAQAGDINQRLFAFLIEQANHEDPGNRRLALRTIGRLADQLRVTEQAEKFPLGDFVPHLLVALNNPEENTANRVLAARALEQIVPASPEVLDAFVAVVADESLDVEIKWPAIRSLENAGELLGERVHELLALVSRLDPAMRWRLAGVFVNNGRKDPAIAAGLSELLASDDADLQFYAVQALGAIGAQAAGSAPLLLSALDSADEAMRESIIRALGRIAPSDPQVKALVATLPPVPPAPEGPIPAFPGAEGRGAYATGGRGGEVYIVTNINNSGPGSLRDAVSRPNRTVVFAVSGTIESRSQLRTAENITIAGQTAPGDGITVADYPTLIGGNNIVRYMRFRLGERTGLINSDAVNIDRFVSNVILDHVSVSWSNDEALSTYDNENVTIQYSLIGEALNYRNHSAGGLWGPRATYHHNLFYSNKVRNPKLSYLGDTLDYVNNVVYNWRERSVDTGSQGRINMIGNYFKPGPSTLGSASTMLIAPDPNDVRLYLEGNVLEGSSIVTEDNWRGVVGSAGRMSEPFSGPEITVHSAEEAYELVLAHAGASLPRRDPVDQRVIEDVINGTGKILTRQSEVGGFPVMNSILAPVDSDRDGMPDMWEIYNGLNPFDPADRNHDSTGDGYTNLEKYLHALTEPHVLWAPPGM